MVKEKQDKYLGALHQARQDFSRRSMRHLLEVSGAQSVNESELILPYGGRVYKVTYPAGQVSRVETTTQENADEIQITDQILILQYLAEVSGIAPSLKWVSFLELPGGPHHQAPFKLEAIDPLVKRFGSSPRVFEAVCRKSDGAELGFGDKAFKIPVFPRISIAVVLWFADEEFPARGNILFDATACMHLNTAGLYVLGINAAERLIDLSEQGGQQ